MRVLVLENDLALRDLVCVGLRRAGMAVDAAETLADADLAISVTQYDCVIADRSLPDGDSINLVTRLRAGSNPVPVIMLTARGNLEDRIEGFERGADDYLVKPFALAELVVRVRALTRRIHTPRQPVVQVGDLEIDITRRRVTRAGILLTVTAKEFSVLDILAERPGDVVSRSDLIERCWDEMTEPMSNVVDVIIGQLRRRLGSPPVIETVRGAGYRLTDGSS